ncbi:MAG TPA: radical SAM protein [Candidatus Dormibacteraeota bacterium]|nr:radical SAM protein [Candidatus Dormibacteraeota bacterium]
MFSVLSPSAPSFRTRRRHVQPAPETLFPELGGSMTGYLAADCPPPFLVTHGPPSRVDDRTRSAVARPTGVANASLVGIARLAANSPPAETRRTSTDRPEYFLLPVKSILNHCDSKRVPFEWTINPYRGCEFACGYCYARYTHEFMELDGGEFEKKIFVKKDAAALLRHDLAQKYLPNSNVWEREPEHIAIGTATDPYQPAEQEYGVTRACLEELAKHDSLSVSIITKSNQIVRDIDVLKKIAAHSELHVNITITTLRSRLARLLEPRAPRPDLRIAALKQLHQAGLAVGVSASPLIPGITDREGDLEALGRAVREAGAQWFFSNVLFLMPSAAKQFLPLVRKKFPQLAKQYEEWYSRDGYAPAEYRKKIAERVTRLRTKLGFTVRPWDETQKRPCAQMSLVWNTATDTVRER